MSIFAASQKSVSFAVRCACVFALSILVSASMALAAENVTEPAVTKPSAAKPTAKPGAIVQTALSVAVTSGKDVETRLRSDAKSGTLKSSDVDRELKLANDAKSSSAIRLARAGAVMNVALDKKYQPTLEQLENLLKSDLFELRILAVDWFRAANPKDEQLREKFLKQALVAKPIQVRERAARLSVQPEAP